MDKIGVLVLVSFLAGVTSKVNSPFREGVEYRYEYEATATTGVLEPASHGSTFGIQAKLFVQISADKAQLKFRDVLISTHNGPIGWDSYPDKSFTESPTLSSQLAKPFFLLYNGTKVSGFGSDPKDATWAKNFKRSISGLLQFKLGDAAADTTEVVEDTELNHYGSCLVSTTVSNNADGISLEKQRNLELCSLFPTRVRTTMRGFKCGNSRTGMFDKSSAVVYKIAMNRGYPEIQSLRAQGTINLVPFADGGSNHFHFVNQTLVLKKTARLGAATEPPMSSTFLPDLRFQFANTKLDLTAVDNYYLSGEDSGSDDQAQIRQKLLIVLLDIVETVYEPSKNDRLTDRPAVLDLLPIVNRMDYQSLVAFYRQDLPKPVNDKLTSARSLFLDAIAMSGSNPAALLIRDLLREGQLPEISAAKLLATFPVYIRRSSMALVAEISKLDGLPLAKDLKYNVAKEALALAIPTLINKACTNQIPEYVDCSPEVVEKWAVHFARQYKESGNYQRQLTAIYGMRNLGVYLSPTIADFIKSVALGKEQSEGPMRSHAIVILLEGIPFNPTIAPALLSIYRNQAEPAPVRIAAVGTLLSGVAPPHFIRAVATSLWSERDPDVLHYVHTALHSVKASSHPCLKESGNFVRQLLRTLPSVKLSHRRSTSYIYDFVQPTNQFGSLLQLHTVASQRDQLPLTVAGIMNYYLQDYTFDAFRFSVHMSGARSILPDLASFLNTAKTSNLKNDKLKDKLEEIMKNLNPADPVHIEVVFTFQGHTAMAYKFDEQKYNQIMNSKDIEAFMQEFKLNFQTWQSTAGAIYTLPSELGMPVSATLDLTGLFSTRIDLTKIKSSGKLARKLNFQLVSQFDLNHALTSYLEGSKSFHSVRQESRALLHLPLEIDVAIDIRKQEMDFKYNVPFEAGAVELASDSRTVVEIVDDFSRGSDQSASFLKKSCPDCSPSVVVKSAKLDKQMDQWMTVLNISSTLFGMEAVAQYKDCEGTDGSNFYTNLVKDVLNPSGLNFRGNALAGLYLWMTRLQHTVLVQADGKLCAQRGRLHRASMLPTTQIVGKIRGKQSNDESNPAESIFDSAKSQIKVDMNWKGEKKDSDRKTDFDIVYDSSGSGTKQLFNIRVKVDAAPGHKIQDHMICVKAEGIFPPIPYDILDIENITRVPEVSIIIDFVMGKVANLANAQCPTDQFRFKFSLTGSGSDDVLEKKEKATTWPYAECKKDRASGDWPDHLTPQTQACYARVEDFMTLRQFDVDVKLLDVPPHIEIALDRFKNAIITALLPYWSAEKVGKASSIDGLFQFASNLTFTRANKVNVVLHQSGVKNSFIAVPLGGGVRLPSARLSSALIAAYENNALASCTVTPRSVITMDNATLRVNIHKCPTLISADCSESPSYGVFLRKNDGPVPLSLIVYIANHTIEITSDDTGRRSLFWVKVNGEEVDISAPNGATFPESQDKSAGLFRIRYYNPFYTISSPTLGFYIQFSGYHVTVFPPMASKGQSCGLCGNSDHDPSNDRKIPSGCEVSEEAFTEQFVSSSECYGQTIEKVVC